MYPFFPNRTIAFACHHSLDSLDKMAVIGVSGALRKRTVAGHFGDSFSLAAVLAMVLLQEVGFPYARRRIVGQRRSRNPGNLPMQKATATFCLQSGPRQNESDWLLRPSRYFTPSSVKRRWGG